MSERHDYRPIKIIIPHENDLRPPKPGGGKGKDFTKHYDESRVILQRGVHQLFDYFDGAFSQSNLPAVARVTLRDDAIAKSHRPDALFSKETCPIIGNLNFGELLVSIAPMQLKGLTAHLDNGRKEAVNNDISKILRIEPYTEMDALRGHSLQELRDYLEAFHSKRIKLRLFDHRNPELNRRIMDALPRLAEAAGIAVPVQMNYGPKLCMYQIAVPEDIELLHHLSSFVGTQCLEPFDQFNVSAQTIPIKPLPKELLPSPDPDGQYPVVGIIDTGTDPDNARLQEWVITRDESLTPRDDQNNEHGSFVAGMVINGKQLNHNHPGFPDSRAKIVDVVAIPGSGRVDEIDLIDAVRYALTTYPDVKVWNLSANSSRFCQDDCFSSFAVAIDQIQDETGALIFNSAGNFVNDPMPKWRRPDFGNADRITAPADSLRAMTVGSIAPSNHPAACSQHGEPSSFTRKGPGAAFVPKPEISHYGGNTYPDCSYGQIGVISIDGQGNLAESVGTSFASPLAATTAAQLRETLEGNPPRHLIKALMIHSAVLQSNELTMNDLYYTGFGKPPTVEEMLACKPSEATLIFDLDLPYKQRNFNKADFPVPPCLHKDGKVFGEIIMTLVYDPPVDPNDGASYSQVNVNPSVGVCWLEGDKEDYSGKLVPYPKDYKDLFEKNQIQHGFKWSPVKVYRKSFSHIDPRDMWRISMDMSKRKPEFEVTNQPVALIVTIRDPEGKQPVYDEVVAMMNRTGWQTQNLPIKAQTRVRAGN
jgi:hypothetical protein